MKTNYIEDRKHIGTIHGLYCIDDYYQARRKYSDKTEFVLILVKNTKNGTKELEISSDEIPEKFRNVL